MKPKPTRKNEFRITAGKIKEAQTEQFTKNDKVSTKNRRKNHAHKY
jgi:hypothetical protein